jgi:2',3'-cyclic-nucleotide 2'-phosphodiesterase (5'-nucleotidase family)
MKKTEQLLLFILITTLVSCKPTLLLTDVSPNSIEINADTPLDTAIENLISPYRAKLDSTMNQVIGSNVIAMEKAKPEGLLGNFIADLCLTWSTRSDFQQANVSILNHGGLRTSLPSGPVTVGNIYELMPFDNTMVLVKLNGSQMKQSVEYIVNTGGQPFSGMTIYKGQCFINNQPLSDNQYYWVLTSDYLANGGDNMDFFHNAEERINTGVLLRQVIMKHYEMLTLFRAQGKASIDNRIQL